MKRNIRAEFTWPVILAALAVLFLYSPVLGAGPLTGPHGNHSAPVLPHACGSPNGGGSHSGDPDEFGIDTFPMNPVNGQANHQGGQGVMPSGNRPQIPMTSGVAWKLALLALWFRLF